jgi:sec-independent protein translocase protein TatB
MFPLEQGAFEMLLIGAIALIVVGPKDLPVLMRKVGQFTAKMRGLAAEFRASFDEMARQSELDELRKEVEALRTGKSLAPAMDTDPHLGAFNPNPTPYGAAQSDPALEFTPGALDARAPVEASSATNPRDAAEAAPASDEPPPSKRVRKPRAPKVKSVDASDEGQG